MIQAKKFTIVLILFLLTFTNVSQLFAMEGSISQVNSQVHTGEHHQVEVADNIRKIINLDKKQIKGLTSLKKNDEKGNTLLFKNALEHIKQHQEIIGQFSESEQSKLNFIDKAVDTVLKKQERETIQNELNLLKTEYNQIKENVKIAKKIEDSEERTKTIADLQFKQHELLNEKQAKEVLLKETSKEAKELTSERKALLKKTNLLVKEEKSLERKKQIGSCFKADEENEDISLVEVSPMQNNIADATKAEPEIIEPIKRKEKGKYEEENQAEEGTFEAEEREEGAFEAEEQVAQRFRMARNFAMPEQINGDTNENNVVNAVETENVAILNQNEENVVETENVLRNPIVSEAVKFDTANPFNNPMSRAANQLLGNNERIISSPVLYLTKVYHENLNNYSSFIVNKDSSSQQINDNWYWDFDLNAGYNNVSLKKSLTESIAAINLYFNVENKYSEQSSLLFNVGFESLLYDLDTFKEIEDSNLYISASSKHNLDLVNINYGAIGSVKLSDKVAFQKHLKLNVENMNARLFINLNKNFQVSNDLYFSTDFTSSVDFIKMDDINFITNIEDFAVYNKVKIKNYSLTLPSQSLNLLLNKSFYKINETLSFDLFAGFNLNYTKKDIKMIVNNINDTDTHDVISGFKLKNYNYAIVGTKINLFEKLDLNLLFKSNLDYTKDNRLNLNFAFNM